MLPDLLEPKPSPGVPERLGSATVLSKPFRQEIVRAKKRRLFSVATFTRGISKVTLGPSPPLGSCH